MCGSTAASGGRSYVVPTRSSALRSQHQLLCRLGHATAGTKVPVQMYNSNSRRKRRLACHAVDAGPPPAATGQPARTAAVSSAAGQRMRQLSEAVSAACYRHGARPGSWN